MTRRWFLGVLAVLVSAPRALSGPVETPREPKGWHPVGVLSYQQWQEAMRTYRPGVGPPCCACEHPGEG